MVDLTLTVNGRIVTVDVAPLTRLLDVLREDLGLTGTKEGCGEGECGACAVLLDSRLVNSCLVPALQADGSTVVTIEGLAGARSDGTTSLHPLQSAMWEQGGAQCGFCTPGMVLAAADLLSRNPSPDRAAVVRGLSGNLCRCTGYARIVAAVERASTPAEGRRPEGES